MGLALQVLVGGVAAGSVYGLVAVGHAVVYRLTGTVALAYGDLIGLGVFATLLVAAGTGPVSQTSVGSGRYLLAVACGVLICVAVGIGGYVLAVEPFLLRGSTIGWIGGMLALAFAVRAVLQSVFSRSTYVFPDPIPFRKIGDGGYVEVGGATVQVRGLFVLAVALFLAVAAAWFVDRTRSGLALRSIADDSVGARLAGVPVETFVALAFGAVGGLAAIAAVVAAPSAPVSLDTWPLVGVKGLAAALLVRFALPAPAFAAGIGLGLLEATLAEVHVGSLGPGLGWSQILPVAAVLLLIAARPPSDALDEHE